MMQTEGLPIGALTSAPHAALLQATPRGSRPLHCRALRRTAVTAAARGRAEQAQRSTQPGEGKQKGKRGGLGDLLGPIGLTLGGRLSKDEQQGSTQQTSTSNRDSDSSSNGSGSAKGGGRSTGIELGPIALSFADDQEFRRSDGSDGAEQSQNWKYESISSVSTDEWRQRYERDGAVDLWVEEEFNSGSRLTGGRDAHRGAAPGSGSGEGPSAGVAPKHTVKIYNRAAGQEVEVEVPEDRYILHEAEEQGLLLPWACRMGCCTACAVRVLEGHVHQPQALGVSRELREQGYALMCTSFPMSDAVLEVVEEDEIYDKQFGEAFARQALNPNDRQSVMRDDFALEIADMDE